MKTAPLRRYRQPGYPTRPALDACPELLRAIPRRWQHRTVLSALAAGCLLSAALHADAQPNVDGGDSPVAPLFQHGDGYGSFGCVATNPPVFLSEEEARQVIIDEGKRAGLQLTPEAPTLEGVYVPIIDRYGMQPIGRKRKTNLPLDGTDAERKVSFEFISSTDLEQWETRYHRGSSTAYGYTPVGAALQLREYLAKAPIEGRLGLFYDPCTGSRDVAGTFYILKGQGTPLAPIRALAGWLGAAVQTGKGTVTLTRGETTVLLTVNSAAARVKDRAVTLPAPVIEEGGTGFAPAVFLAEALGAKEGLQLTPNHLTIYHPDTGDVLHLPLRDTKPDSRDRERFTPETYQLLQESAKTLSREQLRLQVRDFLTWLKAEGVI